MQYFEDQDVDACIMRAAAMKTEWKNIYESCRKGDYSLLKQRAFCLLTRTKDIATLPVEVPTLGLYESNAPYVIDDFEELEEDYALLVFCRFYHFPLPILEGRSPGNPEHSYVLREMTKEDVKEIFRLYEDQENVAFLPPLGTLEEEEERWIAYEEYMYRFYEYGIWAVIVSGTLVGQIGLEHTHMGEEMMVELGYHLDRRVQHEGLAKDICEKVLSYAATRVHTPIVVRVNQKNLPSIRLAKKLGFVPSDQSPEDLWIRYSSDIMN
ncbi:MAG: GNAT family N-acetyltransferase [Lachnospiraceae bacterium]|nr:GNAT family N-acetyltransferase [Lachnospiraceae bacterium]